MGTGAARFFLPFYFVNLLEPNAVEESTDYRLILIAICVMKHVSCESYVNACRRRSAYVDLEGEEDAMGWGRQR